MKTSAIKRRIALLLVLSVLLSGCVSQTKAYQAQLSSDVLQVSDQVVDVTFSALDIDSENEITIQSVAPINTGVTNEQATVTAYDIALANPVDFIAPVEIAMPYDVAIIDQDARLEDCIIAAFYDQTADKWQPVPYYIDRQSQKVIMLTSHFSTYAVFTFKNSQTRHASAFYNETGSIFHLSDTAEIDYEATMQEYIDLEGDTGSVAFDVGLSLVGNEISIGGNALTLKDLTLGEADYLKNVAKSLEAIGIAAALYQLAVDIESGDAVATMGNATKNIGYYVVGKWGSNVAKAASVGVFAIDYSLNTVMNEAWAGREEIYLKAYQRYYYDKAVEAKKNGQSIERWFYEQFYHAYRANVEDGGDRDAFKARIEAIINNYVNEFWQSEDTIGEYYQIVTDNAVWTGGGLNDNLTKKITNAEKNELIRTSLAPVFSTLAKNIRLELFDNYTQSMRDFEALLNQRIKVKIYEKNSGDKPIQFAGGKYQFAELGEGVNTEDWRGTLDQNGAAQTDFTVLGHIESGMPNALLVYRADQAVDEEAVKRVSFDIADPDQVVEINIGQTAPTFDELVGEWDDLEKCRLTLVALDIPWEQVQAIAEKEKENAESDCELVKLEIGDIEAKANEFIGTVEKMQFSIEKTADNAGILTMHSFPEAPKNQCEGIAKTPWYITYDNGKINFDLALLNNYILENSDKDEVNGVDALESTLQATFVKVEQAQKTLAINGNFTMHTQITGGEQGEYSIPMSVTFQLDGERTIDIE